MWKSYVGIRSKESSWLGVSALSPPCLSYPSSSSCSQTPPSAPHYLLLCCQRPSYICPHAHAIGHLFTKYTGSCHSSACKIKLFSFTMKAFLNLASIYLSHVTAYYSPACSAARALITLNYFLYLGHTSLTAFSVFIFPCPLIPCSLKPLLVPLILHFFALLP